MRMRNAVLAIGLVVSACATAPEPTADMREYQTLSGTAAAATAQQRYPDLVQRANHEYQLAAQANEKDDAAMRRQHIQLAKAQLRTAIALSEQQDAMQDRLAAESQVQVLTSQLTDLTAQRGQLQDTVARLEQIQTLEQRLNQMQLTGEARAQADRARQAVQEAARALDQAVGVGGERFAAGDLREARRTYDQATQAESAGRYDDAVALAREAEASANRAHDLALPSFQQQQVRARVDRQVAQMFDEAARVPALSPRITPDGVVVSLRELFDVGSDQVRPTQQSLVDQVASLAKHYPGFPITVEGHTDNSGSASQNLQLSQGRAAAVMEQLARAGVARDRMVAVGRGSEQPLATNDTAVGRAENRRVDVVFHRPQPTVTQPAAMNTAPVR